MDTDDVVNHCSGAYAGGMVTGMVFQMVLAPEASEAEAAELESEAELLEEAESGGCFVAGTKVLTKEGEKPIDQIKKGEKVWSRDPAHPTPANLAGRRSPTRSSITTSGCCG